MERGVNLTDEMIDAGYDLVNQIGPEGFCERDWLEKAYRLMRSLEPIGPENLHLQQVEENADGLTAEWTEWGIYDPQWIPVCVARKTEIGEIELLFDMSGATEPDAAQCLSGASGVSTHVRY